MAMNKMLDVRVEAEAILLTLSCAAFYVKGKTTDPVMMDVAKKNKGSNRRGRNGILGTDLRVWLEMRRMRHREKWGRLPAEAREGGSRK